MDSVAQKGTKMVKVSDIFWVIMGMFLDISAQSILKLKAISDLLWK